MLTQQSNKKAAFFKLLSGIIQSQGKLQLLSNILDVLILDEPELGLHPYAINIIAGLIQSISPEVQVILATQSTLF